MAPRKKRKKRKQGGKPPAGTPTIREWLTEHKDKIPEEMLIYRCMKALGVCRPAVQAKLREISRPSRSSRTTKPARTARNKASLSKEEFLHQFDDLTAAKAAIEAGLEALGDDVIQDTDFRRNCNGPSSGWKEAAEEFSENQFRCGGKIWWSSKATVKQMIRDVRKAKEL